MSFSAKKIGILVLGAHRSGTSALTRTLSLLGADLPTNLLSAQPDNPTGFWESQDYVSLNDELLAKLGLSWDSPLPARWEIVDTTSLSQYRDRIQELLRRDFDASKLFALKDPRLCRLLPVWRPALEQFHVELKCILLVRHPLEVASSLIARNALQLQTALLIWLRHLVEAEFGTRGLSRLFVSYERLLYDWRSTMQRIAETFNLEWPQSSASVAAEIESFLQADLRHHSVKEPNENGDQILSLIPAVRRAYGIASSVARGDTADVPKTFEEVRSSLLDADSLAGPMISNIPKLTSEIARLRADTVALGQALNEGAELRQRLNEREGELTSLRAEGAGLRQRLNEREGELTSLRIEGAELRQRLNEREGELNEREGELTSLRAEGAGLRQRLNEREAELKEREGALAEDEHRLGQLGAELLDLRGSTSWRLTAPLRELRRFGNRLRRAIWPRRYRFKLHPALQLISISAVQGLWQAQGPDQQFLLIPDRGRYPTRWCELDIKANFPAAGQFAVLRVDLGGGFSKDGAIALPPPKDGVLRAVIELPRLTHGLRLDPRQAPGRFQIKDIVIREISRARANKLKTRPDMEVSAAITQPSVNGGAPHLLAVSASEQQASANGGEHGLDVKTLVRERLKAEFAVFLASGADLVLPHPQAPLISVVLVLYNQVELTYACLCSLVAHATADTEVVIIDNASTDGTTELLERVRGAVVVRNKQNRFFPGGCNQALEHAHGEYLLLLNNDAQLLPGSLQAALAVLQGDKRIGAVGARILNLAGSLQEAGGILWSDGSTMGYGRDDICDRPEYMFRHYVDYCSAAFLLTRTRLFQEMGGFDEVFSPGYYEDTDFCVRLWKSGLTVVYEPRAAIVHFEFGSSDPLRAGAQMVRNRAIMCSRHADYLASREQPVADNSIRARDARRTGPRVLLIDDCIPHLDRGSGYPRANAMVNTMARMGMAVTVFPTTQGRESWRQVYRDLRPEIEVMADASIASLREFLMARRAHYDVILVSRPHNLRLVLEVLRDEPLHNGCQLVYDAEAVFGLRTLEKIRVLGNGDEQTASRQLEEEFQLAAEADQVLCVSRAEALRFIDRGISPVYVLGHSLEAKQTSSSFDERRDILFVGETQGVDSPNADSVLWFCRRVLPLIRIRLPAENIRLIVVGHNTSSDLSALADDPSVELVGFAEELGSYYERARIFVAPTRFAAGISLKVYGVAARGIPVVATTLIAEQLGWVNGEDLLSASATEPEEFAEQCVRLYGDKALWSHVRNSALARVQQDCSPQRFEETLRTVIMQPPRTDGADSRNPYMRVVR